MSGCGLRPTRYRVVVLTSSDRSRSGDPPATRESGTGHLIKAGVTASQTGPAALGGIQGQRSKFSLFCLLVHRTRSELIFLRISGCRGRFDRAWVTIEFVIRFHAVHRLIGNDQKLVQRISVDVKRGCADADPDLGALLAAHMHGKP